jgi:alpha-ketoglutarate-dependent taurine dioxygenase
MAAGQWGTKGMFQAKVVQQDLRDPLDQGQVEELKSLLYENLVLVFPLQALTSSEFLAFANQLGDTRPSEFRTQNVSAYRKDFPEILVLDRDYDPVGGTRHDLKRTEGWHSDPRIPGERDEIGMLLADNESDDVAPTQWLDLRAAYRSMTNEQKEQVNALTGIHRNTHSDVEEIMEFHRPLVARHPVTNELSLDIHQNSLWDIEGMPPREGRRLIDDLFARVSVADNIYTHRWKEGDLVMWDNLSLVHRRLGALDNGRRLQRIYAHAPESSESVRAAPRIDIASGN